MRRRRPSPPLFEPKQHLVELIEVAVADVQHPAVAESAVRVRAEFENPTLELRPGIKAALTIYLGDDGVAARPTAPTR